MESGDSGLQALDAPGALCWIKSVHKAVMHAAGAALPKLHVVGHHAEAAPEIRQRHLPLRELVLQLLEFHHEEFARGNNLALVGDPRAEL